MKKLLLTSSWLPFMKLKRCLVTLSEKPLSECSALIMHTAKKRKQFGYVKALRQSLIKYGLNKERIYDANIIKNTNAKKFNNIDLFFSCGGNTFYIIDRVRKTGFDKWIKDFIRKGGVYVGASAGSIIVHKTIELAGWGKERDLNEIRLKKLGGLNITNIAIFPHYKKRLEKEIKQFKKNAPYPVVELKDKQALLIVGNKKRLIK